jgi:hypothetical protein
MTNHTTDPSVSDLAVRALAISRRNPPCRPDHPDHDAIYDEQWHGLALCMARNYGQDQSLIYAAMVMIFAEEMAQWE